VKYAFIKKHTACWCVKTQCRVLKVSRSAYYRWFTRTPSVHQQYREVLDQKIVSIFTAHKARYGSPRITNTLREQGELINRKRIEKRMKALNIRAKHAKKFKRTTDSNHRFPVAANRLAQDFSAIKPNQKWVGDITFVWTQSGWLYLAVIIDLFSRQVIGWSMSQRMTKQLVCDALTMALWRRHFPKGVIVHSDRGSQYCSTQYQQQLSDHHLLCSMSGRGNCYDNAVAESFFHTLKVECLHDYLFTDRETAQRIIFEYIEIYYNQQRKHSTIGYKTPVQQEGLYYQSS
jgi:putative transposase